MMNDNINITSQESTPGPAWWARKRVWGAFFFFLFTIVVVIAWWFYWAQFVWTDDARIDGDMPMISSKIQGRIARLWVAEGDQIQPGQPLATLHDAEIQESVAQLRYALEVQRDQVRLARMERAKAEARLEDLVAGPRSEEISQAEAHLRESEAAHQKATQDWKRAESLFAEGMIPAAVRDNARLAFQVSEEARLRAKDQLRMLQTGERPLIIKGGRAEVDRAQAAHAVALSRIREMEAGLRRQLEVLRETVIRAEQSGVIAKKIAQVGEVVQPGQPLYRLMQTGSTWALANIEETEIGKVHVGQWADLSIDAYPGVRFRGKVAYVGQAAMSVFSLFPAQNAPGTFVKVTQRIPVKISIESPHDGQRYVMRPGMSVEVKIRLRDSGSR